MYIQTYLAEFNGKKQKGQCAHMYINMYLHIRMCIHVLIYKYKYKYTYIIHTYVYIYISISRSSMAIVSMIGAIR